VVELTLEGPGKNALGTEMMDFIIAALDAADGKPILMTGSGDAFSAGLNLKEVASLDAAGMEAFLRKLDQLVLSLYNYPGPLVALVNGHAIAGGCVLALCCDRRVAVAQDRARIGLNEVALGLRFPPAVLEVVRRRLPVRHIEAVLLGAGLYGPDEAAALGLVDEVVAPDRARTVAEQWVTRLGAHPPEAYAATKKDIRGEVAIDAELDRKFVEDVLPLWTSTDLKERLARVLRR
jgi:enoyl-CoA hydratase/carnithine racemase